MDVPTSVGGRVDVLRRALQLVGGVGHAGRGVLDVAHQLAQVLLHVADGDGQLVDLVPAKAWVGGHRRGEVAAGDVERAPAQRAQPRDAGEHRREEQREHQRQRAGPPAPAPPSWRCGRGAACPPAPSPAGNARRGSCSAASSDTGWLRSSSDAASLRTGAAAGWSGRRETRPARNGEPFRCGSAGAPVPCRAAILA